MKSNRLNFSTLQARLILLFSIFIILSAATSLLIVNIYIKAQKSIAKPIDLIDFQTNIPGHTLKEIVQESIEKERQNLENAILGLSLLAIVFQILAAAGISTFIIKKTLTPLRRLNTIMSEINDLNLTSKVIQNNAEGEISELIDNFNRMITRIQSLIEKEKEFLQNISHELKTPLAIIRTNLESTILLKENKEDMFESINNSIKSVDDLNKLINDLILVSKIEKKQLANLNEEFNVVELIKQVQNDMQLINKIFNFETSIDYFNIKGSSVLFKRAIENLVENAFKYSKKNAKVLVQLEQKREGIVIKVKDNGIGINKSELKKIFERMYRVDNSRARKTGGAGLGLAIAKSIIEAFNGKIGVKSTPGKGSEFWIEVD